VAIDSVSIYGSFGLFEQFCCLSVIEIAIFYAFSCAKNTF